VRRAATELVGNALKIRRRQHGVRLEAGIAIPRALADNLDHVPLSRCRTNF
jgi:hypothetical protein